MQIPSSFLWTHCFRSALPAINRRESFTDVMRVTAWCQRRRVGSSRMAKAPTGRGGTPKQTKPNRNNLITQIMKTTSFWTKDQPAPGSAVAKTEAALPRIERDFSAEKYTVPSARPTGSRQWDRAGENPAIRDVQDRVQQASTLGAPAASANGTRHCRAGATRRSLDGWPHQQWPHPDRGRAGPGQDTRAEDAGMSRRAGFPAHAIHAGHASGGHLVPAR